MENILTKYFLNIKIKYIIKLINKVIIKVIYKIEKTLKEAGKANNVGTLQECIRQLRGVQKVYAAYSQEQVDRIFFATAMAANTAGCHDKASAPQINGSD